MFPVSCPTFIRYSMHVSFLPVSVYLPLPFSGREKYYEKKSLHSSTFKGYVRFQGRRFKWKSFSCVIWMCRVNTELDSWSEFRIKLVCNGVWKLEAPDDNQGVWGEDLRRMFQENSSAWPDLSEAKKGGFWRRKWALRRKTEQRENPGDQNKLIKGHFGRVNVYHLRQSCLRFWSIRKFTCCILPLLIIPLEFSPKQNEGRGTTV